MNVLKHCHQVAVKMSTRLIKALKLTVNMCNSEQDDI